MRSPAIVSRHPIRRHPIVCLYIPDFASWAMAHRWKSTSSSTSPATLPIICESGHVYSCSPSLRKRGVNVGDTVDRARSLAPDVEIHLRDVEVEKAVWTHLLSRLYTLTPQILPLTATAFPSPISGEWALLQNLDMDSFNLLTQELNGRTGVAPARSWSMLAAAYSYPGRSTTIPPGMVMPFLQQAPVSLLQQVGFNAEIIERLDLFGLVAIAHVTTLTKRHLAAQFGAEGERLFQFLHPQEDEEGAVPHYRPAVLSVQYEFEWPVFEPADLQPVLTHLLEQLLTQLAGRSARHISLCLKGRTQRQHRQSSRILKDATARQDILATIADTLLQQALLKNCEDPGGKAVITMAVYSMVVELSGLSVPQPMQSLLFRKNADIDPLARAMDVRFPGKLTRPIQSHVDPFFSEEEYRFESVCR